MGDLIQDVTISSNLVDSPVRLIAGEGGLDFNLERILKAQGQDFEGSKKVIEINLDPYSSSTVECGSSVDTELLQKKLEFIC